ncbi:MAG: DedA family protein [Deltaproteobacteria bacterium]|nr:DedA family protein [Deltaproteobacteria bacterium]
MEIIQGWIVSYGYVSLIGILMLGIVGAPFPDDLVLLFTGYLVSAGYLKLEPAMASAWVGSLLGISLSYALGRFFGFPIVDRYGHLFRVTSDRLHKLNCWYGRFGKWGLLFGYFVAGVRHWTAFFAGVSKLRLPVFALFAYTGGLLWSVTMISMGYILGEQWAAVAEHSIYQVLIFLIIGLAFVAVYIFNRRRVKQVCAVPVSWPSNQVRP